MAEIQSVVDTYLGKMERLTEPSIAAGELALGVSNAGNLAGLLWEQLVHPVNGKFNEDAAMALVRALILTLGRLGPMLDANEEYVNRVQCQLQQREAA